MIKNILTVLIHNLKSTWPTKNPIPFLSLSNLYWIIWICKKKRCRYSEFTKHVRDDFKVSLLYTFRLHYCVRLDLIICRWARLTVHIILDMFAFCLCLTLIFQGFLQFPCVSQHILAVYSNLIIYILIRRNDEIICPTFLHFCPTFSSFGILVIIFYISWQDLI